MARRASEWVHANEKQAVVRVGAIRMQLDALKKNLGGRGRGKSKTAVPLVGWRWPRKDHLTG